MECPITGVILQNKHVYIRPYKALLPDLIEVSFKLI